METRMQSSEVRIPKIDSSFEFSTVTPCQYFQSSFARSLSFNTNQSQSLDFELSFRIGGKGCPATTKTTNDEEDEDQVPPPLPSTAPPSIIYDKPSPIFTLPSSKHQHQQQQKSLGAHFTMEKHFIPASSPKRRYTTNNIIRSHQVSFLEGVLFLSLCTFLNANKYLRNATFIHYNISNFLLGF